MNNRHLVRGTMSRFGESNSGDKYGPGANQGNRTRAGRIDMDRESIRGIELATAGQIMLDDCSR